MTSVVARTGFIAIFLSCALPAAAQTGVGDDRVSLPDGPGSLGGMGDNASINPNMGQMSTSVPLEIPAGFDNITPALSLDYSSGNGNSTVGLGWSSSLPTIERMAVRGLPQYTDDDRFVANGSEQLVQISTGEPAIYRARFEGSFVRYAWHDRGIGDEGYWTAEFPNGVVATFGATAGGVDVDTARARAPDGVYRYLVTSMKDRFGHETRYDYELFGNVPLIDQISYVFTNSTPRYRVTFDYEARDDVESNARGGYNELLEDRLAAVNVFVGTTRLTRYLLSYEPYAAAGGSSRLSRVDRFGKDGGQFPIAPSFVYSQALGGVCDVDGRDCALPFLVDMGALPVNLQTRTANLIDINGDALPDVVDTSVAGGAMRIYLSRLAQDGSQDFAPAVSSSVLADSSGFELDSPRVQMLDFNGDGFVDLVNQQLGKVVLNTGHGDWDSIVSVTDTGPDFSSDFDPGNDGDLTHVRFFDADGDGRIDILRTSADRTEIFHNNGDVGGYTALVDVELIGDSGDGIGKDFGVTPNFELADINGDGLLDPVQILAGRIDYQLNLGFGRWSPIVSVTGLPFSQQNDVDLVELEDINGDGIDDAVVVQGGTVRFAINRNGAFFDAVQTIADVDGAPLPTRATDTAVVYADMNGNGSNDIVWILGPSAGTSAGHIIYLELFPLRANLLTHVENSLGLVTDVTYSTAALERARSNDPDTDWPDPIPTQMIVVSSLDVFARNANADEQHDVSRYAYRAGFYDGEEKLFRGFSTVDIDTDGDEHQLSSHSRLIYDTGDGVDRAQLAGVLLQQHNEDGDGPVTDTINVYELCAVDDVPVSGLDFPVRFVCKTASETIVKNGAPATEWATVRSEYAYDGYGNRILEANLGVTAIGGAGCEACSRDADVFGAPCGAQCLGDERYAETDYIAPANTGRWLTELASEERSYGRPGSPTVSTVRAFYDGAAFVGLDAGSATLGLVTRIAEQRVINGPFEDTARNAYDNNGNLVDTVEARGSVDGTAFHTKTIFDADGLDPIAVEKGVGDAVLKRIYEYDAVFGGVSRATGWFIVGDAPADDSSTSWAFDEFGRITSVKKPGSGATPTESYDYDYGTPRSRVVVKRSSIAGGAIDLQQTRCLDGFGRVTQTATKIDDDRFIVSGASVFNRRGATVKLFQSYETTEAAACDAPGAAVAFDAIRYDGDGSEVVVVHPDASLHGGVASRSERRFGPLSMTAFDEDDTDANSPSKNTPSVQRLDGLGRTVAIERTLTAGGVPEVYALTYDELGNLRGFVDPEGHEKVQRYDLSGRLLQVVDPDRGTSTYSYDADDNLVRSVDSNGTVTVREYDALSRMTAEYDEADEAGTRIEQYFDRHPVCLPSTCTNTAGQLAGTKYPIGALGFGGDAYGYNARGQVDYTQRTVGAQIFETTVSYDNADRVVEQVLPGDQRIAYEYDAATRLTKIPGFIDDARYDSRGHLSEVRYANGTVENNSYDIADQLSSVENVGANGEAFVSLAMTRNRKNHVVGVSDTAANGLHDAQFTFDALERLIGAEVGTSDRRETLRYRFSSLDAIVEKTSSLSSSSEHVGAYTYGAQPRAVTTAGDVTLRYDAAGQAISRGAVSLAYDFKHRVTKVRRSADDVLLQQSFYTPAGERILEIANGGTTYELAPNFEIRDGITRLRLGVTDRHTVEVESAALMTALLPDVVVDGVINAADAFAASTDADADAVLRGSARRLLLDADGTATAFLALDHVGSTVAVTNADGVLTERLAYQPFGSVREASAVHTEYASFGGHDVDAATGFIALGERLYSPTEGRFLAADDTFTQFETNGIAILGDAAGGYTYCNNDPGDFTDATGRWGVGLTFGAVVGAATGGISNIVGAVLGGGVALVAAIAEQRALGNWSQKSGWAKIATVAKIALQVGLGATSGFFSSGLSAIPAAVQGVVSYQAAKARADGTGTMLASAFLGGAIGAVLQVAVTLIDPGLAVNEGVRVAFSVATSAGPALLKGGAKAAVKSLQALNGTASVEQQDQPDQPQGQGQLRRKSSASKKRAPVKQASKKAAKAAAPAKAKKGKL